MRTFTSENDTVLCFDLDVWKQEKNLIFFKHDPLESGAHYVKLWTNLHGSSMNPIARYTLDAKYEAVIDVSDYIRANPTVTTISVECQQDSSITIPLRVVGLINPARLLVPRLPYNRNNILVIEAPKVIYNIGVIANLVEFRGVDLDDQNNGLYPTHEHSGGQLIEDGTNIIPSAWGALSVVIDHEEAGYIEFKTIPCDVVPACVEWVGATGAKKRAIWLVGKHTTDTINQVALMPIISDFKTAKGRADGLAIYLDGLCMYDYFYYSDILISSDVRILVGDEISTNNITDGEIDERYTVDVVSKTGTIPDGNAGEFGKLEVTIKWREYATNM